MQGKKKLGLQHRFRQTFGGEKVLLRIREKGDFAKKGTGSVSKETTLLNLLIPHWGLNVFRRGREGERRSEGVRGFSVEEGKGN